MGLTNTSKPQAVDSLETPTMPSGLFDIAGLGLGAGGSGELSDVVVERLMMSLGAMEDDYARTLAAEKNSQLPLDPVQPQADAESDGESSRGEDEADPSNNAYQTIGSDCGAGSPFASDDDMDVVANDAPREAPTMGSIEVAEGSNVAQGGVTGWSQPSETNGWPQPPSDDDDFQDFAAGGVLESFADFGASNPALPAPLPGVSSLQSTLLTDTEVELIKETMRKVELTPPAWAKQLHDSEFQMMMRKALQGTLAIGLGFACLWTEK